MRPFGMTLRVAGLWLLVAGLPVPARTDAVDDAYEFLNQRHIPFTEAMFLDLIDRSDDENMVIFMKAGMDPNLQKHGTPVLVDASRKGKLKVVQALLEGGALPNIRDARNWSALHYAALFDHLEVARALVAKGADVRATTPMGMTALHYAVQERDPEMVALLLDNGALPEAPSKAGVTPLAHAIETDQPAILKLFERKGLGPRIKTLRKQFSDELTATARAEQVRERERKKKLSQALAAAGGSRNAAAPSR